MRLHLSVEDFEEHQDMLLNPPKFIIDGSPPTLQGLPAPPSSIDVCASYSPDIGACDDGSD